MQTPINPKGFTNQNIINDMFGMANPGTFTRTVGQPANGQSADVVPTNPLTGLTIDPTADQSPSAPLPPPAGVQSDITPPYGLNTY
jgi:hypothetical protein